jgi:hypothetical protein
MRISVDYLTIKLGLRILGAEWLGQSHGLRRFVGGGLLTRRPDGTMYTPYIDSPAYSLRKCTA